MRKFFAILLAVAMMTAAGVMVVASEMTQIDWIVEDMTIATDKNGRDYVRFIVPTVQTFKGHSVTLGVPAMAFGSLAKQAMEFERGDDVSAIVTSRNYQGRPSYTILKFLMTDE